MRRSTPLAPLRASLIFTTVLIGLTGALGCHGHGSGTAGPTTAGLPEAPATPAPVDPVNSWGTAALTQISGVLSPDGTVQLDSPPHQAKGIGDTFDLDATEFFQLWPCTDCAKLGAISVDGSGNVHLPFTVKHPFALGGNGRYDLDIFDPRGILIIQGNKQFPGVGLAPINTSLTAVADTILQGDPDLVLNADGYTTQYDFHAADPDYGTPRNIPGNLNPFKRYFVDESNSPFDPQHPAGWNVMPMGGGPETQEFILSKARLTALGKVPFVFVLDACYGASATKTTRQTPSYYLPEFNRKEAWSVGVQVISSNLQVTDKTSRAVIEVTAKDWQQLGTLNGAFPTGNIGGQVHYSSKIKEVDACIPGVVNTAVVSGFPYSGGGSNANPLVYRLTLKNDLASTALGPAWGLVAVRDELYQVGNPDGTGKGPMPIPNPGPGRIVPRQGMDIRDYSAYQYFQVNLGPSVDDPPVPDLSLTTPRRVTTGTAITLNGQLSLDDIGITKWEFDPTGSGTFIDNTAANPPFKYTYVYTTPLNVQSIYNATLRLTDTGGQTATVSIPISVTTTPDAAPVARITEPNPWSVNSGTTVVLDGAASTDDNGITKYEWNPGDGSGWHDNGAVPNWSYTFTAPGVTTIYNVQLRVTDTAGQTNTANKNIQVVVIDFPPTASLVVNPVSPGTDAPRVVQLDASGSTDDFGIQDYRFDPGDGSGWSSWQVSPLFNWTYIPFIDTTFTAKVQVRDTSLQTDITTADVVVTVPGGCLISGVTGPSALNVGETETFSVVGVGLVVYQWSTLDPDIQFIGPTNGPSVDVKAVGTSASANNTTFTISGNAGTCSFDVHITCYSISAIGAGHTRQYVNLPEDGNDNNAIGTRVTIGASITPPVSGIPVTFNFTDPDEDPQYQYITGVDPATSIVTMESDTDPDDNRGDVRRPDGSANPLEPGNSKYQNGFEQIPGPVYVNQTTVNSNALGSASAVFKTSRFGGDNYQFSASADPAGNGFGLSANAAGTLTVWRWYGAPTYSMYDSGGTLPLFYMPVTNFVNANFAPAYVEINFSTPSAPSPPTPQGYGGMLYTSPINATFAAQSGYVQTAGNYANPATEDYFTNGSQVKPNLFVFGHNSYSPGGVIGLCTTSYNPALKPPPDQQITSKPFSTTNYVGVAMGAMGGFGFNAQNEAKTLTHEIGHAMGLPHSDTGSAGNAPDTDKFGVNGIGIMRPAVNTGEAALWTQSEIDFMRGIDKDLVNGNVMRGTYYEG